MSRSAQKARRHKRRGQALTRRARESAASQCAKREHYELPKSIEPGVRDIMQSWINRSEGRK